MVLILVVGDSLVPQRTCAVPAAFCKLFAPGRIDMVLITGNVGGDKLMDYLYTIAPRVYRTRGEYDARDDGSNGTSPTPSEAMMLWVEGISIGLLHGHQVVPLGDEAGLTMTRRMMGVDILVSGATHSQQVFVKDDGLFVNPGSLTGACHTYDGIATSDVTPSFVLLNIQGDKVTVFAYQLTGDEVVRGGDEVTDDDDGLRIRKREWGKLHV